MVDQIVEFSHLLRSQGIRVSVAENMDAVRALECLDMANLYRFKSARTASIFSATETRIPWERSKWENSTI